MSKKDTNITYQKGKLFPNLDFQNLNKEIETVADKNFKPPVNKKPIQQKYTLNPALVKEIIQNQAQQSKQTIKRQNTNTNVVNSAYKSSYLTNFLTSQIKNSPNNENNLKLDTSNESYDLKNKQKELMDVSNSLQIQNESQVESERNSPKHKRQDSKITKFATINLEKAESNLNITNGEQSLLDSPNKNYNFRVIDDNSFEENKCNAGLISSLIAGNNSQKGDIELEKLLSLEDKSKNEWKNNKVFENIDISNQNNMELLGKQKIVNQILVLDHFSLDRNIPLENKIVSNVDICLFPIRNKNNLAIQNQNFFEIYKLERKRNTIQNIFYFNIFQEKNRNFESCSNIQFNYEKDNDLVLLNRKRKYLQNTDLDKCIDFNLNRAKESSFNQLLISEPFLINMYNDNQKEVLEIDTIYISYFPSKEYKRNGYVMNNVLETINIDYIHEKKKQNIIPVNNKDFELVSIKKIIPYCLELINDISIIPEDKKKFYSVNLQEEINIVQRPSSFKQIMFENCVQNLLLKSRPKETNYMEVVSYFNIENKKILDFGIEKNMFSLKSQEKTPNIVGNNTSFTIQKRNKNYFIGIESINIMFPKDKNRYKSFQFKKENQFSIDSIKKKPKFLIENNINSIKYLPKLPLKFKNLSSSQISSINYEPILKNNLKLIENSYFSLIENKKGSHDHYSYMKRYSDDYLRNEVLEHFSISKMDKTKFFIKKSVVHMLPLKEDVIIQIIGDKIKHLSYEECYRSGLVKNEENYKTKETGDDQIEFNRAMSRNDRDGKSHQLKLRSIHHRQKWQDINANNEISSDNRQVMGNTLTCLYRKNSDIKELFVRDKEEGHKPKTERNKKKSFKVSNKKWSDEENALIEVKSNNNIFTFNNFQRGEDMPTNYLIKGSKNAENNDSDFSAKPKNNIQSLEGKMMKEEIVMGVNKKRHLNEINNLYDSGLGSNLENYENEKAKNLQRIANLKERLTNVTSGKGKLFSNKKNKPEHDDILNHEDILDDRVLPTADSRLERSNNENLQFQRIFSDKTWQNNNNSLISKPFSSKLVNSIERNFKNDMEVKSNVSGKLIKGYHIDSSNMFWDDNDNFQSNFNNFQTNLKEISSTKSNNVGKNSNFLNIDIRLLEKNLNNKVGFKNNLYNSDNHLTKNNLNSFPINHFDEITEKYKESSVKNLKKMLEEDKSMDAKSIKNSKYTRIESQRKRLCEIDLSVSNFDESHIKKDRYGKDLIHPPNLINIFNKNNK